MAKFAADGAAVSTEQTGNPADALFGVQGARNLVWFILAAVHVHLSTRTWRFKRPDALTSSATHHRVDLCCTSSLNPPDIKVRKEIKIKVYRLDNLFGGSGSGFLYGDFDFVNIDTQGAKLATRKGMGHFMWQESLKAIYLELNREAYYAGIPMFSERDDFLASHSFFRVETEWTGMGWGDVYYPRSNEFS